MEKKPVLVSSEVGRDEDSTQTFQRKLEALKVEIESFAKTAEKLNATAISLIDRQHYDSDNIAAKQVINFKY